MRIRFWGTRGSIPVALTSTDIREKIVMALMKASGRQFASIEEAASRMVAVTRRIEPSAAAHDAYRDSYEAYKRAYSALASVTQPRR